RRHDHAAIHYQFEECCSLWRLQIYRVPDLVTPFAPRIVACQYRLSILFRVSEWQQGGAERRCVLDAVDAGPDRITRVNNLEMAHHRYAARMRSFDGNPDQRQRQTEIDLDG